MQPSSYSYVLPFDLFHLLACAYHPRFRTYPLLLLKLFQTKPDGVVPYADPPNSGSASFNLLDPPSSVWGSFSPAGHADLIAGQDDPTKQNFRNATSKAVMDEDADVSQRGREE